jgi:hypothetical protein
MLQIQTQFQIQTQINFKPRPTQVFAIVRTWGAAVLRPYMTLPGRELTRRITP